MSAKKMTPSASALFNMVNHDIFSDNIMSFLTNDEHLILMKMGAISRWFSLPTHFCRVHGNRLKQRKDDEDEDEDDEDSVETAAAVQQV